VRTLLVLSEKARQEPPQLVPVDAGGSDGQLVRVRRGLSFGDRVVLHPGDDVVNGGAIRVASK